MLKNPYNLFDDQCIASRKAVYKLLLHCDCDLLYRCNLDDLDLQIVVHLSMEQKQHLARLLMKFQSFHNQSDVANEKWKGSWKLCLIEIENLMFPVLIGW